MNFSDLEGPTPCSYSPAVKPLKETNSPSWSFGKRNFIERGKQKTDINIWPSLTFFSISEDGGSRTSWQKQWFANNDTWKVKVWE